MRFLLFLNPNNVIFKLPFTSNFGMLFSLVNDTKKEGKKMEKDFMFSLERIVKEEKVSIELWIHAFFSIIMI